MSGLLTTIFDHIKSGAITFEHDVVADLKKLEPEVIADLDKAVTFLTPIAMKGAQEIEQAVIDGSLLKSEKRSALVVKLESAAQEAGYTLDQQGIGAAINLALEFGVNLLKMILGQALGAPSKP